MINFIKNKSLFLKIIVSAIPIMIVGYLLVKLNLIDRLRNFQVIGWMTIIFGVFLYIADKRQIEKI